jgi:hypothetical protein
VAVSSRGPSHQRPHHAQTVWIGRRASWHFPLSTNASWGLQGVIQLSSRSIAAAIERRFALANFSALVFVLHLASIVLEPPSRDRLIW